MAPTKQHPLINEQRTVTETLKRDEEVEEQEKEEEDRKRVKKIEQDENG